MSDIALQLENLDKTYTNGVHALKGLNLQVNKGDFFALLGPNGAGKSTTIGIITSLVIKSGGKVKVFDKDLDIDPNGVKSQIGLVPQEFNFNIFHTVEQIVVNSAGYYGVPRKLALQRAEKYLHKLGLWEKRNTKAIDLSGGMKRRLMIARGLMHEPELLILDEPTAGVDIELRRTLWSFLQEVNAQGTTIILTTHYLEEAEHLCENIAIIDQGHLIEHTDKQSLLAKLHSESFILDLEKPLNSAPDLATFGCDLINEKQLVVNVEKSQAVNELFALLSQQNIQVTSMRNKSNRLEELFLKLVATNEAGK